MTDYQSRANFRAVFLGLLCWVIFGSVANAADVTVEILPPNYLSCGGLEVEAQGSDDSLILKTAVWDWGDGAIESAWIPGSHQYTQNGDYTISLTLTFETGETASDTRDISISNSKDVGCGLIDRVQLEPAYLMLSAAEQETGQLTLRVWDSDGLEGQTTEFSSQFVMDANPYAVINGGTGLVTAVTPLGVPLAGGRLSTDGISWVDGSNAVRVRVTKTDLDLEYIPMRGRQITYYLPRVISGVNLENLAMKYQLVEATDLAYQAQAFGNGYVPFKGHTQYLAVDADKIEDPAEDTLPCGSSGNPIGIGWAIDAINGTYGGCFIYSEGVPEVQLDTPRWSIIFHEMGHSFFGESRVLEQIINAYSYHGANFTEGMASFGSVWSLWSLLNCPTQLSPATLATIQAEFSDWKAARAELLVNYQAGGPNFDEFDSETLIATLFDLYDDYGPKVWYDYYSLFYPKDGSLSCTLDSLADQFGIVAATISASTGEDLRDRFKNEYGFPIEDDAWPTLMNCATERVAAREYSLEAACAAVAPEFTINAGLNDAWYFPDTSGQGFFITVFPDLGFVSLAWFTYDTELPPEDAQSNLGDAGHRWITAIGQIDGDQVVMDIDITSGGIFDTPTVIEHTDPPGSDGTLILTFDSCNSGTIEYDIPSINRHGTIPIIRVANDNIVICEALSID